MINSQSTIKVTWYREEVTCEGGMADETKAANHIDFTSLPYDGPALRTGRAALEAVREEVAAQAISAQRGWYYSGLLEHTVIVQKDPGTFQPKASINPIYKTSASSIGAPSPLASGTHAPGAPKEYMATRHANGMDGRFTDHLAQAGMSRRTGLNTDMTKKKAGPDPTAWGFVSMSNY